MPSNYNKTRPSKPALPRRLFILLVGLLLGSVALAHSHPGSAADRQGITYDPITARPTANRFDFASETFRTLLRHQTQTPVRQAPSRGEISELRTPSGPPRTLNGNTRQAAEIKPLEHPDTLRQSGSSRPASPTRQRSKQNKAPNVAGWKKFPTVRSIEVPPNSNSAPARLPPARNWKSPQPPQSGNNSNETRSQPTKPASSKTRRPTKRVKRRKAVTKKKTPPAKNWQQEVLFDD